MNPLYNLHNQQMTNLSQIYQIMNSPNPMVLFNQLAMGNPNLQPIANALKNGANPQNLFFELCKQKGVDPNQFLEQLKGNMR